jgi:Photoprotection regulator fluorescence recovery protein
MQHLPWTGSEKKIARRAFEEALEARLAKLMADFKARAAAVARPAEMWDVEQYLREQRQEIDQLFDYRYSQLPLVFGRLIRSGELNEERLSGLSEEKLEIVRRIASWQ